MRRDHIILLALVIFFFSVMVGYIFFPSVVYDRWIWKYYWGPVVADALGREVEYHGVVAHEGYTIVSEITYGIIALLSLYYIYRLLKKLNIDINWNLCKSLFPFIIFGSVSRVLEDAGYFKIPLSYWFISPLIYVQVAAYALVSIILGWTFENRKKKSLLIIYAFILILLYTLFWSAFRNLVVNPVNPMIFAILVAIVFTSLYFKKDLSILTIPFSIGLTLCASGLLSFGYASYDKIFRIDVILVCISFPITIIAIAYLLSKYIKKLEFFSKPLNLAMLFGHSLDGFTSYISIYDPFNMGIPSYGEKHPVSFLFMDISSGVLFPIVKVILIVLIILIFEDVSKKEKSYSSLLNLLKIAIFILGFSPGLRDLLRVAIGV